MQMNLMKKINIEFSLYKFEKEFDGFFDMFFTRFYNLYLNQNGNERLISELLLATRNFQLYLHGNSKNYVNKILKENVQKQFGFVSENK